MDHRGVAGNVTEFDGNLGLVIGAGGGCLTLFDAVRKYGGKPANYCEIGGNPSVAKAAGLAKLVLSKPGVDKIAVMMSIVSNTRVDIVARGVSRRASSWASTRPRRSRSSASPARGRTRASRSSRSTASSTATAPCRCTRPRSGRWRRSRRSGSGMSILIDQNTTFIVQGITGREAVNLTRECLDYGVGEDRRWRDSRAQGPRRARRARVRHRRAGRREPRRADPDGSVVTVPPAFTKDAVFEAIEHGIELIVIVTERIPRRDVAQMVELANLKRRAHHRPQLPRRDRARRDQDGRHRRARQGRGQGLHSPAGRRDVAQRRHDHGDLEHAHGCGPRRSRRPCRSAATRSSARPTPS